MSTPSPVHTAPQRLRSDSRIKALVLSLRYPHRASYYDDWSDAFAASPFFISRELNILGCRASQLRREIDEAEVVVALHSCSGDTTEDLERLAPVLADRRQARFVSFVGNEYNSPYAPLGRKVAALRACHPDIVATQLLPEAGRFLYDGIAKHVISLPHALNPDVFRPGPALEQRQIDIGVRSFRYSPLLGDDERNRLIDYFQSKGGTLGLSVDISTEQRFGREGWANFLASSRGTVSSEAGSWYLDRDDALVTRIHSDVERKRRPLVIRDWAFARRLVRHAPMKLKSALAAVLRKGPVGYSIFEDESLDLSDLKRRFFDSASRCSVYSKALSSRHFDAIGTKTCQILSEGRYNDLLVANEHYIPVARDLSNIEEAVARFKSPSERARIVDAAYEHAISAHTYRHRLAALHGFLQAL